MSCYNKQNHHHAQTENLQKDLNINEVCAFFGCKTVIGRSFLEQTLCLPIAPQDLTPVVSNRQNAIQALVVDPELKQYIEKLLEQAQGAEQAVIKLLSEPFKLAACPELANLEIVQKQNPKLYPWIKAFTHNSTMKTIGTVGNIIGWPVSLAAAISAGTATYYLRNNPLGISAAVTTLYWSACNGFFSYAIYKDYTTASEKRTKMHSLYQLITIAEQFEALCKKAGIKTQCSLSNIKDSQGRALINGLKHARYRDKNTAFFALPLVHAFLFRIYEQQDQLAQILACIAEMDAYNALATTMIDSQNQNNKFCFVNFIENSKPTLQAMGFWNVIVKNAVPNTIAENNHIILTGPNAGGKTTTIKALLQNIVFSQTFGIAAAESFAVTPFDVINSYLNISDDLINGLSLFASEIKRAQEIVAKIASLHPNQKFFCALDELFTGTAAADGELCAYNFIQKIAQNNNTQCIYATHFNKLKELGSNNPSCRNYKVGAPVKDVTGKLVYPFILSQGASESTGVALDMAAQANLFA